MSRLIRTLVVVSLAGCAQPAAAQSLDAAKALYAGAAYEEALMQLEQLESTGVRGDAARDVRHYQALCLLALRRPADAERTLERLITDAPDYLPNELETPPQMRTLVNKVRRRVLPAIIRAQFDQAKRAFDRKEFGDAQQRFSRVLALLDMPDGAAAVGELATDLRTIALSYQDLAAQANQGSAEGARRSAATTPSVGAPPTPSSRPTPAPTTAPRTSTPPADSRATNAAPTNAPASNAATTNAAQRPVAPGAPQVAAPAPAVTEPPDVVGADIFSAETPSIAPPVAIEQQLPRWAEPRDWVRGRTTGLLELVINERGGVESARLRRSINPAYDRLLLERARTWRYRPAMLNSRPVKYLKIVEIVPTGS